MTKNWYNDYFNMAVEGRNSFDREIAFGLALMAKQHLNKNKMKKLRIKIHSEAHNRAVQERLFEMGYKWEYNHQSFMDKGSHEYIICNHRGLINYAECLPINNFTTLDDLYSMEIESKKEELEEGNWYKAPSTKWMAYYTEKKDYCPYGWNFKGSWDTNLHFSSPEDLVKATDKEVLDRFRKELKDRGFVEGCDWTFYYGDTVYNFTEYNVSKFSMGFQKNVIYSNSGYIFRDGTFATPIVDALPEIAGYSGEFTETGVKYGCTEVDFDFILKDSFDSITKMEFDGGNIVYYEDLKEVKKAVGKHLDGKKGNTAVGKWVCTDPNLIKSMTSAC